MRIGERVPLNLHSEVTLDVLDQGIKQSLRVSTVAHESKLVRVVPVGLSLKVQ